MLAQDAEKRMTIDEVKRSKWFNGKTFSKEEVLEMFEVSE